MRRYRSLFLILLFLLPLSMLTADPKPDSLDNEPTIALVLSGGGALGLAHIGVLEVIEELGIPIDLVVGTSMGGLVGGLYSVGYTPLEIKTIVKELDWLDMFVAPSSPYDYYYGPVIDGEQNILSFSFDEHGFGSSLGVISDQKILSLLSRLVVNISPIDDFDEFYRPFRTVGVDILTGEEIIFESGSLVDALRATMSIPSVFAPYEVEGRYFIDGGTTNNLPVDVALDLGADLVIAVDVDSEKITDYSDLRSSLDIFSQYVQIVIDHNEQENSKLADVLIEPDLTGLNVAMFTSYDEFLIRGEEAARDMIDELKLFRDEISACRSIVIPDPERIGYYNSIDDQTFNEISVSIDDDLFPIDLFDQFETKSLGHAITAQLEQSINRIVSSGRYDSISYGLIPSEEDEFGYDLQLRPTISDRGKHSLGLGFSFDGGYSGVLDESWYLDPSLTASLVMTELFGTNAYALLDMKISDQFIGHMELFSPIGPAVYIRPTLNLYNEEFTSEEGSIDRSILLSASQELGLLIGKFTEIGLNIKEQVSWIATDDDGNTDLLADFDIVYGPSINWQNNESHRFIHDGIISKSSIDFSILGSDSWYQRICIAHDHHLPITDLGTLSYDILFGSYKGKFTNRQLSFDIGGWDGIPGYLTSKEIYDDVFLIGAAYQHRFETLSQVLGVDIYGITEFKVGNGWDDFPEFEELTLKYGSAMGLGINSFFGDVILGIGINQDAQLAYYILMN